MVFKLDTTLVVGVATVLPMSAAPALPVVGSGGGCIREEHATVADGSGSGSGGVAAIGGASSTCGEEEGAAHHGLSHKQPL